MLATCANRVSQLSPFRQSWLFCRREAVPLRLLREVLQREGLSDQAHTDAHRREAVHLSVLRQALHAAQRPHCAHDQAASALGKAGRWPPVTRSCPSRSSSSYSSSKSFWSWCAAAVVRRHGYRSQEAICGGCGIGLGRTAAETGWANHKWKTISKTRHTHVDGSYATAADATTATNDWQISSQCC